MLFFAYDLHMTAGGPWMSRSMLPACALAAHAHRATVLGQPARNMHVLGLKNLVRAFKAVSSEPNNCKG